MALVGFEDDYFPSKGKLRYANNIALANHIPVAFIP